MNNILTFITSIMRREGLGSEYIHKEEEQTEDIDLQDGNTEKESLPYGVDILTGIRPTGDLTIANYVGAIKPLLNLQEKNRSSMVFVADLHALTDNELVVAEKNTPEVVADYLALGLDPNKCEIFVQSAIKEEVFELTNFLLRHVTVSELLRVPTLKEKLKDGQKASQANALLANYPVLMTADILLQRAKYVPVGEDQLPHMEMARTIIRRFNKEYGNIFPQPLVQEVKPLRLKGLDGEAKMSKTHPEQAIFLTDTPEEASKKIKRAKTAFEGEITPTLLSHIELVKSLAKKEKDLLSLEEIIKKHTAGEKVMGTFKDLMTSVVTDFLKEFQEKRILVINNQSYVSATLERGTLIAKRNAQQTLKAVYNAMRT